MPLNFDRRLERAIERGQQERAEAGRLAAERALSEDELKTLHSKARLELSDHIEGCLKKLADHFPGFEFSTLVSEDGWGARISRDDLGQARGRPFDHFYSHLEMCVRPYTSTHIVELIAKGAIRNKEVLNRSHFQMLQQVDIDSFVELIDLWVLEYAEQYAAKT